MQQGLVRWERQCFGERNSSAGRIGVRNGLEKLYSKRRPTRRVFSGTFGHISFGQKRGYPAKLLVVRDVRVHAEGVSTLVADHVWVQVPGEFVVPSWMPSGTQVVFSGVVGRYARSSGIVDFKIEDVEDIVLATDSGEFGQKTEEYVSTLIGRSRGCQKGLGLVPNDGDSYDGIRNVGGESRSPSVRCR